VLVRDLHCLSTSFVDVKLMSPSSEYQKLFIVFCLAMHGTERLNFQGMQYCQHPFFCSSLYLSFSALRVRSIYICSSSTRDLIHNLTRPVPLEQDLSGFFHIQSLRCLTPPVLAVRSPRYMGHDVFNLKDVMNVELKLSRHFVSIRK